MPAPVDTRLPGAGGYPVSGLYDLNPDKRGVVDNYVTAADRYGRQIEHWNGIDAVVTVTRSRLMIQGGLSTGRTSTDVCSLASQLPERSALPSWPRERGSVGSSAEQAAIRTQAINDARTAASALIETISRWWGRD